MSPVAVRAFLVHQEALRLDEAAAATAVGPASNVAKLVTGALVADVEPRICDLLAGWSLTPSSESKHGVSVEFRGIVVKK